MKQLEGGKEGVIDQILYKKVIILQDCSFALTLLISILNESYCESIHQILKPRAFLS